MLHLRTGSLPFRIAAGLAVLAGALAMSLAPAGNLSFLENTPLARMTDEDVQLMRSNAEAALADAKTPSLRSWSNASTGHSGAAETLQAFDGPNGLHCKRLRITNHADGRHSKATYTVCDLKDTGWRLVPNDFAPVPKYDTPK